MTAKVIKNNVVGGETLAWDILKGFEFNTLKSSDSRDVSTLKNAIVNGGFSFVFFIWNEHRYVIDGKGRYLALIELEKEGYEIPDLPVSYIQADNKAMAKRLALQASSQHGEITEDSFKEFTIDLDLQPLDFEMFDLGLGELSLDVGNDDIETDGKNYETEIKSELQESENKIIILTDSIEDIILEIQPIVDKYNAVIKIEQI